VQFTAVGTGRPPPIFNKVMIIKRTGWTLTEYDAQPADELQAMIRIMGLTAQKKGNNG
jgi:hypothetical protein